MRATARSRHLPGPSPLQATPIGRYVQFPIQRVHLELTNACNFDCVFCPMHVMTRPYGFMDPDLARRIIDQISELSLATKLTLHVMGEPFLHRDLYTILDHCTDASLPVGITTNGSYLSPELADRLAGSSVTQWNLSLQTPDEASFATRVAPEENFTDYAESILAFIGRLREHDEDTTIKVHLLNTRFRSGVKQKMGGIDVLSSTGSMREALKDWARRIYALPPLRSRTADLNRVLGALDRVSSHRWNVLEIAPNLHLETYVLDGWGNAFNDRVVPTKVGYCSALRDHFAILHTGDFVFCCKDFDGRTVQGSLKDRPLVEILNSPEVLNVVEGFGRFQVRHSHCQTCLGGSSALGSMASSLGSILFFRLAKRYFYHQQRLF